MKIKILFFFCVALTLAKPIRQKTNLGVTSLNQACTAQGMAFSQYNITTVEQVNANIYDVFSGNNLHLDVTTSGSQKSIVSFSPAVTSASSFPTPNGNFILKFYDLYEGNQIQLMKDNNNNYFVQEWTQPTQTIGPDATKGVIPLNNDVSTQCFSVKYLTRYAVVVDCQNMKQKQNLLYFVDILSRKIDLVAPTDLLHENTTSANNRDMQVVIQNERVYLLRTTFYQDWNSDESVNRTTLYTFTEVVRATGVWTSFKQIQLFSLPPIQYPGANMNMQVVGLTMNSGYLFLLDQLNQAVWKITLDFTYITYVLDIEQIGLRGSMTQPLAIGSSKHQFGPIAIAYQGTYKARAGTYMEEVDPTLLELGPVYQIDSDAKYVNQIVYGPNLICVSYSNSVRQAVAIYLAWDFFEFNHDSQTTYYGPMVYLQLFDPSIETAFISNEVASALIVSQYNSKSGTYSQSQWLIQNPQIMVASGVTGDFTATFTCYSGFQSLNSTTPVSTTTQATSTVKLKIVGPNFVMGMVSPFGPHSTAIGAQQMTIATPGQAVVDLDQFYIAPALSYTVTLTASASSVGWASDLFSVYTTKARYSNTSFVFPLNTGKTLGISAISFIKPQMVLPGRTSWLIESNNNILYHFIEDDATNVETFFEYGKPYSINTQGGKLISFDYFGPEQFVFVTSDDVCSLKFFSASHSQPFWSTSICDTTYEKIIKLKVYGFNNVYAVIQGVNSTTTVDYNSIVYAQVSNKTFSSQSEFNKMIGSRQVITGSSFQNVQLKDFQPLDVFGDWMRFNIIFIKCSNYVLVYNQALNYVYSVINPTWTTPTDYAVAVTMNSLVLIQTNKVEEYFTLELTRIYRSKSAYPYYGQGTQSYLIGDNQYTYSMSNVYLYESTTKTLQVFITGNMIPMVFMLFDSISLPVTPTFLFLTKAFRSNYEQVTIFGTNYCGVYNIYRRRTLAVNGYFNNTLGKSSQNYQFSLIPGSSVGKVSLATIPYTVTTTAVPFTNISLNSQNNINYDFIDMKSSSGTNMLFPFPSFKWFTGTVTHYQLQCVDQPQECNASISIQSPIGPDRIMGNETLRFFDMAAGVNNFSFVQMNNKVLRLTGSQNKIYDLVQLPFGEPSRVCLRMAVDPLAQYSVSACTQFSDEGWGFYFVSYLSTEPHLMGGFYDSHPSFIEKMLILDNYLFVFEGNLYLNGIHIYEIDFDENFGDAGSRKYTLPNWLIYKNTLQLNDTIHIRDVKNVDILATSTKGIYRVFMTSSFGEFLSIDINPQDTTQNMIRSYYKDNLYTVISQMDASVKNQADFTIGGFKACEYNSTNAGDQYTIIVAFKYYHAYELQAVYPKTGVVTSVQFSLSIRYLKYAFYEFQDNIQVLPKGFVILSGFLPDYLGKPSLNHSAHLFMAYDRTNATFQQFTSSMGNSIDCYLMGGYPFKNKERFPYMAQAFKGYNSNNYSITLVSPDNFTFFSYTLQRQSGIKITTAQIQSNNLKITAVSEFSSYSVSVNIERDFSSSSSHPYWVIGLVLGIVALIVICGVAYWYCKKRKPQNQAYNMEEDIQQGISEGN